MVSNFAGFQTFTASVKFFLSPPQPLNILTSTQNEDAADFYIESTTTSLSSLTSEDVGSCAGKRIFLSPLKPGRKNLRNKKASVSDKTSAIDDDDSENAAVNESGNAKKIPESEGEEADAEKDEDTLVFHQVIKQVLLSLYFCTATTQNSGLFASSMHLLD